MSLLTLLSTALIWILQACWRCTRNGLRLEGHLGWLCGCA